MQPGPEQFGQSNNQKYMMVGCGCATLIALSCAVCFFGFGGLTWIGYKKGAEKANEIKVKVDEQQARHRAQAEEMKRQADEMKRNIERTQQDTERLAREASEKVDDIENRNVRLEEDARRIAEQAMKHSNIHTNKRIEDAQERSRLIGAKTIARLFHSNCLKRASLAYCKRSWMPETWDAKIRASLKKGAIPAYKKNSGGASLVFKANARSKPVTLELKGKSVQVPAYLVLYRSPKSGRELAVTVVERSALTKNPSHKMQLKVVGTRWQP